MRKVAPRCCLRKRRAPFSVLGEEGVAAVEEEEGVVAVVSRSEAAGLPVAAYRGEQAEEEHPLAAGAVELPALRGVRHRESRKRRARRSKTRMPSLAV